ncbi:bifunctional sugar-binding transcriptional regulator/dihydroxyacetone kinase subunit DhaK [Hyphomicrobiales bacterium BP6-180914]|uniref:Bifunctional sugar-binding transcriptional regulator/dihydroxyacetone kinase subunit DhaK n=1 Tax=Lichenifustis flavocetrariae TaxID=2949735 RepID=A0AA41Z1K7_9HYPH|nr:bifunctional sugar-binding transcriptional regulator/dihydroxyacetone kinase subunit DhaK [Lichenifustis flavocetrariae]MCW6511160.1 bifunctional sugar-binding transcriptional regulator/dihydroxyacetone kinase subunit DhaK [Lichenifustis flavocetrariae]
MQPHPVPLRYQDDPLVWAGWLYVQDGLTQNDIASVMGVSRTTVNNYLAEARARGIVQVSIDQDRLRATETAQALKQHFGLSDCVVIPGGNGGRPLMDRLGEAGGGVLRNLLRAGDTLGVAWSRTMMSVADHIGRRLGLPDLSVVQATGGTQVAVDFSPEDCASRLAAALGARCITLAAPALVSTPVVRDMMWAEPVVRERFDLIRRADKLIFGVCNMRRDSLVFASGQVDAASMKMLLAQRATAAIAGRFIDQDGVPLNGPQDERILGLTLAEFGAIKVRIAVAGGLDKVAAILACLRGGHATVLVTDAATAGGVLKADGAPQIFNRNGLVSISTEPEGSGVKTKKLVNDARTIIEEMLEGVVAAHPRHVRLLPHSPRSLVAVDGPRPGKVGLVVGGGSGHEPTFLGFVGRGLADACAVGNVFASPTPDPIVECAKAVDGGKGVLFVFGNYAGDVMNFGMAAELASMNDLEARIVVTTDDVTSAPRDQREKRRGVAGNFFVFKVTGAAADMMKSLDECERVARHANDRTFTVSVALSPCSLPQTLTPNFEIGDDEMEVGLGIHGEPGVSRETLKTADAVTDDIMDRIFTEMPARSGDKVAVLINSLGSTPLMELYLLQRRVKQRLDAQGIGIHASWVGPYCTSLEMAGASITLMLLDDELTPLLDHPCDCAMFRAG